MSTMSLLGEIVGGLGLVLLGLWLATEGFSLAAGWELRQNLERWTFDRWKALRTGLCAALLLPSSHAANTGAIGLVNTGFIGSQSALRVMIGLGMGAAMSAWTIVLVGYQPWLAAVALLSIGAGAALWWSGPQERWGAWGQLCMGYGVLFLGLHLIGNGFASMDAATHLDYLGFGPVIDGVFLFAIGLVAAALVRSAGAVSFTVLLAAAAQVIGPISACLLLIGAGLGSATGAVSMFRTGTACARRVALSSAAFIALRGAIGGFLLLALSPVFPRLIAFSGGSVPALAMFETLTFVLAAVIAVPLVPRAAGFLHARFLEQEQDPGRPAHVDRGSLIVPKLALQSMRLELGRMADVGQELVRKGLAGERLTAYRQRNLESCVTGLSHSLSEALARLHRGGLPQRSAEELIAFSRSLSDYEKLCRLAAYLPTFDPGGAAWMGSVPRTRLQQIRFSLVHFLESIHPTNPEFSLHQCEDEAAAIELRISELEERLLQETVDGRAASSRVALTLKQLAALEFFRAAAMEVARSLESLNAAMSRRPARLTLSAYGRGLARLVGRVGDDPLPQETR